jgi:inosine/xanthosine triphosphatase
MDFIIGSTNQAKVKAAMTVIESHFTGSNLSEVKVPSGVKEQPFGDEETRTGALNRAANAANRVKGAIGIGLEGGVKVLGAEMFLCNWGALVLPDGTSFTAAGAQIPLPEEIASELRKGRELGVVVDEYFQMNGIRHSEGAIGMFTAQAVTRDKLFEHVMQLLIGQLKYYTSIVE